MSEEHHTLALSTCCISDRYVEGQHLMEEVASMGFEYVELSHGVRMSLVSGILQSVEQGVIKVASLHNFCPLPPGVHYAAPNLYEPTSSDRSERDQWLNQTIKTLDFAARLGANVVVLHGGAFHPLLALPLRKLHYYRKRYTAEQLAMDPRYRAMVQKAKAWIFQKSRGASERLIDSLEKLLPYAQERGIKIGLENRDSPFELPTESDFVSLMKHFESSNTYYYWHDTGHAQIKESMGFAHQLDQLQTLSPYLMGYHLKDALPNGQENLPIGEGTLDFARILKYAHVSPNPILTIELAPGVSQEKILQSKKHVEQLLTHES